MEVGSIVGVRVCVCLLHGRSVAGGGIDGTKTIGMGGFGKGGELRRPPKLDELGQMGRIHRKNVGIFGQLTQLAGKSCTLCKVKSCFREISTRTHSQ